MLTLKSPALGYAVAEFGRLTLTSHDYARYEPTEPYEDSEAFYLNDPSQRNRLLLKHGHDAVDLVSRWRYESRLTEAEQRQAFADMMTDRHMEKRANQ